MGDPGLILGWGRSPGEGNGNPLQYSCLEIPWTEELGRLQSMGSQRVRHDWATETHTWERQVIAFIELLFSRGMAQMVKNLPRVRETWVWSGFDPWIGKISWRKEWQPTPVFLPGEFHGQGSLAGYSPWGHKELDMTEWLTLLLFFYTRAETY